MKKENIPPSDFPDLRKEAEELSALSKEETVRLVYDLRVQNDELRKAQLESQSLLQKAEQIAHVGTWKLNYTTGEIQCSDESYRITGFHPTDDQNSAFFKDAGEAIHPDDRERATNAVETAIAEKKPYQVECRIVHSDGSIRHTITKGEVVCDDSGELIEVVGIIQDITERKQVEKELYLMHERLKLATQSARLGIWDWDIENDNLSWDDKLFELYGIESSDFTNVYQAWLNGVHPEDRSRCDEAMQLAIKGEKDYDLEFRILLPDKNVRHVQAMGIVIRDKSGQAIRMIGVNQNITERKQAIQQTNKLNALLKSSVESPNLIILSIDKQYRYLYFNKAHINVMVSAYGENIDIGMNLLNCISDEKDRKQSKINYDRALAGEKHVTVEEYGDLKRLYYETRYNPILDENNEIIGATAFSENVTNRIQAEKQIKASLVEKETLLQEIHHRVKNNMSVVSSLLGLQISSINDEKAKEALKDSQNRVQTMSMIHESLYRSDNLASIDMQTYFTNLGKSIFQGYNVNGKVILKIDAEYIFIGAKQSSPLGLIVNEMLSNSLKHAFPDNQQGEININLQKMDDQIELIYSDDGIGIAEDFDIQNADSLGLKLIKLLAEGQLDGSLDMESKNGTKFTITFNLEV